MKLTEILSIEKWLELEKKISCEFGLNVAVFDAEGARITDFVNWANELCPIIKKNKQGQSFICAAANNNMMTQARKSKKTIIGTCDAGLLKIVSPVFVDEAFLGVVSACGQLGVGEELEFFLVNKITGIDEQEILGLSKTVSEMEGGQQQKAVLYIEECVQEALGCFQQDTGKSVLQSHG